MADKTFRAKWLGDSDPLAQSIVEGGVTFVKDEPVNVSEGLTFNGVHWANNIKQNPTFAIEEDAEPVDAGEDDERAVIKGLLDDAGVKYRDNASLDSLRDALAKVK